MLCAAPNAANAQDPKPAFSLDSAWAASVRTHDTTLALQLFADDSWDERERRSKDRNAEIATFGASGLQMEYFGRAVPRAHLWRTLQSYWARGGGNTRSMAR